MAAITDSAQLKVDLRKAQEACEKLTEQLTEAEAEKDKIESSVKEMREELDVARKTKDHSVQVGLRFIIFEV